MPFGAAGGYYTMQVPINLATLAYFNVPLINNTINLLQDFSISPLHIVTDNATVKAFFTKWFESIKLNGFMSQFFMEYYRSGNIFIYRYNGKIADDQFKRMKTAFSARGQSAPKSQEIPVRYTILDPKQVYLQIGPAYSGTYSRMLSTFELERLRNPKTPEDVAVLNSFPPEIRQQIKNSGSQPYIFAPLDLAQFYYCFYRKQPYEPLAVPMIWPLLDRIEYKLALQKMDASLIQTTSMILLHVASGSQRDQYNPGTNPQAMGRLTAIFQNATLARSIITDHNTKIQWVIPNLKDLLGKDKYEQVDQDIKDGLGSHFFGNEKFANAIVKAKIFIKGLAEGRRVFIEDFLQPEVNKLCETFGFKNKPLLEFEKIDIEDQSVLQRVYVQMAQLGLLTSKELNDALDTGILPTEEQSLENQKTYKEARDKDLYQPLIGGGQMDQQAEGTG